MIKVGIIGLGRMGITHYSIINSREDVEIKAVADPSKTMTGILNKYITEVNCYEDYNKMYENESLDLVIVSTPPNLHFDIVKKAFEKNINVFVEKPFTTNHKEAEELAKLANEKGLVNQVGYVNRFNDMFRYTKELIEDNVIGNVIRFKSEMFSATVVKPDDGKGWRSAHKTGGGCLYEMGAHAIDLVNYIIGAPDKVVGSALNKIYSKNVEDIVSTTFLYNTGTVGTLYVNWCDTAYRKPSNKFEIFGTKGKILVDQHGLKIYMNEENKKYNYREGWNTVYITDIFKQVPFYVRGNEFTSQLYNIVDQINDNSVKNICTFEDGAKTQKIIHEIFNDNNAVERA